MNNETILTQAMKNVRRTALGCHADSNGNYPCDNGTVCDRCNADDFKAMVSDEYARLMRKA